MTKILKRIPKYAWVLATIILVGAFLRVYHLPETLTFAADQRRDLKIVDSVVVERAAWPLLGPKMSSSGGFKLGPFYYYFQIIAAKIFGMGKVPQAYPAVFFSILSIPLLYYFLRKYFSQTASLLATSLYAVSYFDIEYSRFAWNVNLLPFFVLLFLVSFWHFLIDGEKTPWSWIIATGAALGIGVQLHAITLLLLPAIVLAGSAYIFYSEKKLAWKKLLIILCVAFVLNAGQITSELQTGFANSKNFQSAFVSKSTRTDPVKELVMDAACNAEANTHAISSLGGEKMCDFLYNNLSNSMLAGEIISLLFSILGTGFLIVYFMKETDRNGKYFLGLVILYALLYFLVMLPVAPGSKMRYYLPGIYLPFIFLAFIFEYLIWKYPRRSAWLNSAIFIFLLIANLISIFLKFQHPH
jgi:4-amino-4-deoxy-L-arabinose transferase-like glycosyltransferase